MSPSGWLLLLLHCFCCWASTSVAGLSHDEALQLPWCGVVDNRYRCVGRQGQLLVLPCGQHSNHQGLSYTYYLQSTHQVLLSNSSSYLHLYPQWNDSGVSICCLPNISTISLWDIPCYQISVLYPPHVVPMTTWPAGVNRSPVIDRPYELTCPLQSDPPPSYTWTRYRNVDRREKLSFAGDVVFSENGRKWRVEGYTGEHGGVYECHATNQMGDENYSNDGLFFLKATSCSYHSSNSSIVISPISATPILNIDHTLLCTVYAPFTYGLKPYWFIVKSNGSRERLPYRQRPLYNEGDCSWTNEITARRFSSAMEGVYVCQYGEEMASVELELEAPVNGGGLVSLVVTSIGGATLVIGIVLLLVGQRISQPSAQTTEPQSTGFKYDVFISAHDETRELVQSHILQPLESQTSPPYRVCWHLRDFVAGLSITEQIADAVNNSRKILFVFSDHFSESKFCQFELELAMKRLAVTNTRCVVPIATSEEAVPARVRQLLTYWPVVITSESNLIGRLQQILGDPAGCYADSTR